MQLREQTVTPHVAQNQSGWRSAIDGRTTRHPGYAISQRIRKRIEEAFGWAKTVAGLRKMRHRGLPKGRLTIHPGNGRLQSRPFAQTARSARGLTASPAVLATPITVDHQANQTNFERLAHLRSANRQSHPLFSSLLTRC